MILATANTPQIFERGFKWIVGVNNLSTAWSDSYFEMLEQEKQVKTIGYVAEDTPHTREVYEGAIPTLRNGVSRPSSKSRPCGHYRLHLYSREAEGADPDVIYVSAFTPFAVTFKKQAKEFGLKPKEWHFTHADKSFPMPSERMRITSPPSTIGSPECRTAI